jgi:hypothetical protein
MLRPEIEEFAKLLVREVRDRSVVSCDSQVKPESNSPIAKRWREAVSSSPPGALAGAMIPDCIDDALFHLLHAIDSGALRLSFVTASGKLVDLTGDGMGELAGWYMMGKDGWRSRYSQQRVVDDLEDLT